ncbi:nucleotidyltransferase family protein [Flavobacterium adhaerens]|uniref:nucleotidyltransferase family protein n=1 Tax=Flavobacterium adhaerens TaxID=3149043 RepID=UPI0032B55562
MAKIQALLIAAGESKRMGIAKQLLPWGTRTFIEHQIEILQQANLSVAVVLGANAELIRKKMNSANIQIFENKNWNEGMGTSIAYGVKEMMKKDVTAEGILIALVDQPLISSEHYKQLINAFESGKKQIIVSQSDNGLLTSPAILDKSYFEELIQLTGDKGAKILFEKYKNEIVPIRSICNLQDIDTPTMYQKLLNDWNAKQ